MTGLSTRAAAIGRRAYRALPLRDRLKEPLKDAVYVALAPAFRGSPNYQAWHEERRQRKEAPRSRLRAVHRRNIGQALADGRWEWADYEPTRDAIEETIGQRQRTATRVPRHLIRIEAREPLEAAALRVVLPDPGERPDVSIIVPAYGQLRLTIECLLSIGAAAGTGRSFEVIVADDASPDGTVQVVSQIPNVRVLTQPANVGFLINCNSAAENARGRLLVFLNNDTQVQPGWLDALATVFDEEPNVGAVGPMLVYPGGALQEAGVRIGRTGSVELIGLNGVPEDARWSYRRDVDYVSGACLMVHADLFREMGGFDEALAPAYGEDAEFGVRLTERGLRSVYEPKAEVVHHLSATMDRTSKSKARLITRNVQRIVEAHQQTLDELDDVRVVSMYLPQFHPIEQNDLWWGPGFTEWTNVARARPNWTGHYQPREPADLGYYDLRVPDVLESQWQLAARYGIDAFCYYYYWFAGTRLLDQPLERLLDPTRPAHPFCLCWANENWTRRWDGLTDDVLIAQQHSAEDDVAVIRDMARYMTNPEYLRVGGRPILLVYRVDLFPDFARTAERWRAECRRQGIGEIELAMVESFQFAGADINPSSYGCDSAVEFPAHNIPWTTKPSGKIVNARFTGTVADYAETAIRKATRSHPGYRLYRSAIPGWDNTARRQDNPFVLENATPGAFQAWLETAVVETKRDLHGDQRLIFINAWNEWAEAAYLEPDARFGHDFLAAVRKARDAGHLSALQSARA